MFHNPALFYIPTRCTSSSFPLALLEEKGKASVACCVFNCYRPPSSLGWDERPAQTWVWKPVLVGSLMVTVPVWRAPFVASPSCCGREHTRPHSFTRQHTHSHANTLTYCGSHTFEYRLPYALGKCSSTQEKRGLCFKGAGTLVGMG